MSPVIEVAPVVVIPVFDRITKSPDVPIFTVVGPAAMAAGTIKAAISIAPRKCIHRSKALAVIEVFINTSIE